MPQFIKRLDVRTSAIYGVVAILWILLSDTIATALFGNNHSLESVINTSKGLGFVLITTVALYLVLSRELRKQERMEHQLEYERDISPVAIMVFDLQGLITYVNLQAEKVIGQPRAEIVGKTYDVSLWKSTDYDGNPIASDYPNLKKMIETHQTVFGIQQTMEVASGKRILVECNLAPIFDRAGTMTGAISIFVDVTEAKKQEKQLRENEEHFRLLFNNNPLPMWVIDQETLAFLEVNESAVVNYGYEHGEFLTMKVTDVLPPKDIPRLFEGLRKPRATLQRLGEWQHILKNGQIIDVDIITHDIEYAGRPAVLTVAQDISQRKQSEQALRESEARYRMLVEQASDGIFIINRESHFIEVNSAGCDLLGYTREEILQKTVNDVIKLLPGRSERLVELQKGDTVLSERQMIRKDGSLILVEISSKQLLNGNFQGITRDITKRRQAEEELRLKSAALESADNSVLITDLQGVIEWVNPAFTTLTGYTFDEVIGCNPRHMLRSGLHDDSFYEARWREILAGNVWKGELVNRRKDGSLYTQEETITPVLNPSGDLSHFIVIQQDISARKATEEAIQKLNAELEERVAERTMQLNDIKKRIESILNSTADAIIYSGVDGTIEQVNPAFTETFGYQPEEIAQASLVKLVVADEVTTLDRTLANVLNARQAQHVDVTAYRSDGTTFDAAILLSPVIENGDQTVGIVASIHDITSRNNMLHHAMSLSEVKSRYVSMAAHDLRNPMAIILSASETLEHYYDKLDAEKKQAKYHQIKDSIKVMTEILDDILTMGQVESGKLAFHPAPLDIKTFCQSMINEMVQATSSTVQVVFSAEHMGSTVMDAKLLRHIFGNLLSNAIKYSPTGSTVRFTITRQADKLLFCIQDHGIGIPKADQERLFETFHRASNAKHIHGTGLGLAIVKQSVEMHYGTITFESEEGYGTTFIVTLPAAS